MFFSLEIGFHVFKRRRCLWFLALSFTLIAVLFILGFQPFRSSHMMFVHEANESVLNDKLIHKHEYEVLLNNEAICDSDIFIVFLVLTDPSHTEIRQIIRSTWGSVKLYNGAKLRHVFLVGQRFNEGKEIQQKLREESDKYHDIAQGNFVDSYKNLTYKTVFGLHWVQKFCRHAEFIFKVDDDVAINVFKLVDFLNDMKNESGKLNSFVYCMTTTMGRPRRYESSKVHVTYSEYRYFWFPVYCHGSGYIMSSDVAVNIYSATKNVPFIWLEDVYIGFGMNLIDLKITDNIFGFFIDVHNHPLKIVELCILKQLGRHKDVLTENWKQIVSATKNKTLRYKIYLLIIGAVVLVGIVCACSVVLILACKKHTCFNHTMTCLGFFRRIYLSICAWFIIFSK